MQNEQHVVIECLVLGYRKYLLMSFGDHRHNHHFPVNMVMHIVIAVVTFVCLSVPVSPVQSRSTNCSTSINHYYAIIYNLDTGRVFK